jgi:hypothetical protein
LGRGGCPRGGTALGEGLATTYQLLRDSITALLATALMEGPLVALMEELLVALA